jgi:cell division protein FtsB
MWSPRRKIVVALSVLVVGFMTGMATDRRGVRKWVELGDDLARLETENARLRGEIDSLRRKAEALRGDPRSLERAARENGYVRDGELLFELQ